MIHRVALFACSTAMFFAHAALAGSPNVVESADAYVSNEAARQWVIGNARLQLRISAAEGGEFRVLDMAIPQTDHKEPLTSDAPLVTIDGQRLRIGRITEGFRVSGISASKVRNGVRLDVEMTLAAPLDALRVTRHHVVYDGSPTVEAWTTVTSAKGADHMLADLNAFDASVPVGTVRWVSGLMDSSDTAFTLQHRDLGEGEALQLGSVGRSSEQAVPWVVVDDGIESFFAGVMWSGAWSLEVGRAGRSMTVTGGLGPMSTLLRSLGSVEGPHAFFGRVAGGGSRVSEALQAFMVTGLRGGRPFEPLVTHNTWYSHGVRFDERDLRVQMHTAASLGAELFVIDAGWYQRERGLSNGDFERGLGDWSPDPARFPSGLRPLTDYAHDLGLKLGLWVEPERVALEMLGHPGLLGRPGLIDETWLATADGEYKSTATAQICLASPAARAWVLSQLIELIETVRPDYLKWDNNFWINCTRDGHGHEPTDGNYAHVTALYDVLGTLRARYPTLLIENVSGGGRRLDLGLVRYTDVAWMDDRTAPSLRVRHNIQGLSAVFPPAYLLSFVIEDEGEALHNAPDLAMYLRSRMQGVFGLSIRGGQLSAHETALVTIEIARYKTFRDTLASASATLLTAQAGADTRAGWDVLQAIRPSGEAAIIAAFQSDSGVSKFNVRPRGLDSNVTYEVRSIDRGLLGAAKGADLTANGIDLVTSPTSAAHILVITAQLSPSGMKR